LGVRMWTTSSSFAGILRYSDAFALGKIGGSGEGERGNALPFGGNGRMIDAAPTVAGAPYELRIL
jgi:hypothetical protein